MTEMGQANIRPVVKKFTMTPEIETALQSGASCRQGTKLAGLSTEVRDLMIGAGLIGAGRGLTLAGSILASRLRDEAIERAFG